MKGSFNENLYHVNGDSGYAYKITAKDGSDIREGFDGAVLFIERELGHEVVMHTIDSSTEGTVGAVKVNPALAVDGLVALREKGFTARLAAHAEAA